MNAAPLLPALRRIHDEIRDVVVREMKRQSIEHLAGVGREDQEDTIYEIDMVGEARLIELFEELSREHSFVLIGEGLRGGAIVLPAGTREVEATWKIIVDPIDGSRGIMYQKRSAWILTGVAPNRSAETTLQDIVLAVQTEVPPVKQTIADQLWALRGQGAFAERLDGSTGERQPLKLRPSTATTIAHGFATVARFFPGVRDELAAIDDEIVELALGTPVAGKAHCFEDQYISTGGQLYELLAGHDRFVADLRPLMKPLLAAKGLPAILCCHPYDLCTALIAEQLGVSLTNPSGGPLDAPLDVSSDVSWAGYANPHIQKQIEPCLKAVLRRRGWIE